jgi:hypothetical protein
MEYIAALPDLGGTGIVIIDDFHKLKDDIREALADYMKTLADEESKETNIIIHFDNTAEQITVEDPQFIFFIRNIPWKGFAADLGFMGVDFKSRYDFALSFAGEDRQIAEELFNVLAASEVEVFYDKNEQHRILASDIEEYLRPIYQSEALFVVALLSDSYPMKIWAKFESEQFRHRFKGDAVIPIWFSDAPIGMFDESRRVGGVTFDRGRPKDQQIYDIASMLLRKLADTRSDPGSQQLLLAEETWRPAGSRLHCASALCKRRSDGSRNGAPAPLSRRSRQRRSRSPFWEVSPNYSLQTLASVADQL